MGSNEVSLRSVWNVITKIQGDLQERTLAESQWKSPTGTGNEQSKKSYKSMFGILKR